ncbi:MAG: hypothetical protein EHM12_08270 [Dehalococcoidia bacterium]|nr:MAG: hypothetical protein EHM12_08270 [Dehalococcoidia bacterium]
MKIGNNELRITPSTFDEAIDLKDAVEEAINKGNLNLDLSSIKDVSDGEDGEDKGPLSSVSNETVTSFVKTLLSVDMSKKVRNCLFVCAERAVVGTEKINKDFFEKVGNREYYYEIMFEIMKVNISPFFKGLFSRLLTTDMAGVVKNFLKRK